MWCVRIAGVDVGKVVKLEHGPGTTAIDRYADENQNEEVKALAGQIRKERGKLHLLKGIIIPEGLGTDLAAAGLVGALDAQPLERGAGEQDLERGPGVEGDRRGEILRPRRESIGRREPVIDVEHEVAGALRVQEHPVERDPVEAAVAVAAAHV